MYRAPMHRKVNHVAHQLYLWVRRALNLTIKLVLFIHLLNG